MPFNSQTTGEAIMKLSFMRRFAHEHKTIKGKLGQFRRYAHTMDIVLSKLSAAQIEVRSRGFFTVLLLVVAGILYK